MAEAKQVRELVARYRSARRQRLLKEATFVATRIEVVRELRLCGQTFREIGLLLGMSHQRAQQIGGGR